MVDRNKNQLDLVDRVRWQVMFRCAFLLAMGVSAVVLRSFYSDPFSPSLQAILVGGLVFSGISWAASRFIGSRSAKWMAWIQISADLVLTTLLVSITGGIFSAFAILYALQVIVAALVLSVTGAFVATGVGIVSFVSFVFFDTTQFGASHVTRLVLICCTILLVGGSTAMLFRSKERLAQSFTILENLHRAIVDYIPSGIIYLDKNSIVMLMNPAAIHILEKNWIGQSLGGSSLEILQAEQGRFESKLLVEGKYKTLGHHSKLLPEGEKIIVFQDVTDIRELEKKVALKDKLASVGQLAAGIAHEIRNPLASLSGSVQLLRVENTLSEASERLMTIVLRETDRLDTLLQSFLNYAKPSVLKLEKIILIDVVKDVVALVENLPDFKTRSIRLVLNIAEDLWCVCDSNQMKQILWNLLKNSVQASKDRGEISIHAKTGFHNDQAVVSVEIHDNGEGIDPALHEQIFDPFFSTKVGGSGLGLPLVYQIVKSHGGRMGVRGDKNSGTVMWFEVLQDASVLGVKVRSDSVSAA